MHKIFKVPMYYNTSRLDILKNAVKIHTDKTREFYQKPKQRITSTKTYDDSTSFTLNNREIRDNLDIAYIRKNSNNLPKFDGEILKGSRNPLIFPSTMYVESNINKVAGAKVHL